MGQEGMAGWGGFTEIKAKASLKIQIYLHFDAFKTKRAEKPQKT